jgi:hypothetical protein
MFNAPTVHRCVIPNTLGASPQEMSFIGGAVRDEAVSIQKMLPDAMAVIRTAGAVLGLLAIGCAVVIASRSEEDQGNS